jgi:hypothetical protein
MLDAILDLGLRLLASRWHVGLLGFVDGNAFVLAWRPARFVPGIVVLFDARNITRTADG